MSIFYNAQFEQLFPIPLIAFERLSALSHLPAEEALPIVLAECCNKPNPTEAEVVYFLERIRDDSKEAQEKIEAVTDAKPANTSTKTLGTSFKKFLGQLDSARLLLLACGWDYEKAKYLYTKVDRKAANQIIDDFLELQHERNTYLFEATMYGFGGGYTDDEREEVMDLTGMDAAGIMAMLS
jgi:hypothetical protein